MAISSRSRERIEATAVEIGAHPYVHDSADLDAAPALSTRSRPTSARSTCSSPTPAARRSGVDPLGFSREQWEDAYRDLVLAPMALIERAVPGMKERGFGRILNVSSSAVREPIPVLMLSNAHRSGLLAAFKTLARDLAGDGITVNTVLPGPDRDRPPGRPARARSRAPRRRRRSRCPPGGSARWRSSPRWRRSSAPSRRPT